MQVKNIVVVGGGAGGLKLAIKLGKEFHNNDTNIILVDKNITHFWKPLLHEVATGIIDSGIDEANYLSFACNNNFKFELGTLCGLDKEEKNIYLDELKSLDGTVIAPKRSISYDILVLAVGSISNDFGTEGVKDHCLFLDSLNQAKLFHNKMIDLFMQFSANAEKDSIEIAIVGAGATGVELCAELNNSVEKFQFYGYKKLNNQTVKIKLIEGGSRVLPALSEKVSNMVDHDLKKIGVDIKLNTIISKATSEGFYTKDGEFIKADLFVWTAGVKADQFLSTLNLESDKSNRLVVKTTLQTTLDNNIFVIGDCASCVDQKGVSVPTRAQSANQMASLCFENIKSLIEEKSLKEYQYRDQGFLVSLSHYSTIGNFSKPLMKGSFTMKGWLARMAYLSLYKMHQVTIFGFIKTSFITIVNTLNKFIRPKVKLN